jgi:hypothetical protein
VSAIKVTLANLQNKIEGCEFLFQVMAAIDVRFVLHAANSSKV